MSAQALLTRLKALSWDALLSDRGEEVGPWELEHPELARVLERRPKAMGYPAVLQLLEDLLFQALYAKESLLEGEDPSPGDLERAGRLEALLEAHGGYRAELLERARKEKGPYGGTILRRLCLRPCERLRLVSRDSQGRPGDLDSRTLRRGVDFLFTSRSDQLQLHFSDYEARHFDMVREAVGYAETLRKASNRNIVHILTFRRPELGARELEFFKRHTFLLVFGADAPEEALEALPGSGVAYRVRAYAAPGRRGLFDDFVRRAGAGHKTIQTCYELEHPWSPEEIRDLLRELESIAAFVKDHPDIRLANLEGVREPTVLNDEVSLHAGGDLFLSLNLGFEREEWPLHESQGVGPIEAAAGIDPCQRTPFEVFRQLSRMPVRSPRAYRKILLGSLRAGYALDGWLRRRRGSAGAGRLQCA